MKKTMERLVSLFLAGVFAVPALSVSQASETLDGTVHGTSVLLAPGVEMTRRHFWNEEKSDLRTEHSITYAPSDGIFPVLAYGEDVTTRETLTQMARRLEREGGRVLGGINGDYYVMSTGAPLGMVVTDGILRSTPQYTDSWGLGFFEDGTAMIGRPELTVTANFKGHTLRVSGGINKARTVQGGYFLLTDEFAPDTLNTQAGVDVVLRPLHEGLGETVEVREKITVSEASSGETEGTASPTGETAMAGSEEVISATGLPDGGEEVPREIVATLVRSDKLKIGSRVTCEVVEVLHTETGMEVPQGCYVMTINKRGDPWLIEQLASLMPGERMELDIVSRDTRWNDVVTAMGGMYKLVTGGIAEPELDEEPAPRTAVGIRGDGSLVFYTVDGRQAGYSVGAGLDEVARRLVELGCVEAVCMDGGGSTTLGVTHPGSTEMEVVNRPSGGSERANSNSLFLVSRRMSTGVADRFHVTPYDNLLLSGSSIQLSAQAVGDTGYATGWEGSRFWQVAEGKGTVTADGYFTAGQAGTVTVEVSDGMFLRGEGRITVVETPDTLQIVDELTGAAVEHLYLEPNQTVDLKGVVTYRNLPVIGQDVSFVWTADPVVGTVDEEGRFTAAAASGEGYLTVSAGMRSLVIPVTVTGHILPLEDFEDGVDRLLTGDGGILAECEEGLDHVRFGRKSAKLTYDAISGTTGIPCAYRVPVGERYLTLWVWGDGSGNALMATTADSAGVTSDVVLTALDFTGWRRVTVQLPVGTADIRGFSVIYSGIGAVNGVFWLDQMTTSNELVVDDEPPAITMTAENGMLTATIVDAMDKSLQERNLTVTLDGAPLPYLWDGTTGTLTAELPVEDERLHRVSVTAADASGNLTRSGREFSSVTQWNEPFGDMAEHWAQPYTGYLWQQGVVNGVEQEGVFLYQPEKAISRGEFALMVARWQGLELERYEGEEPPFADLAEIPAWMLSGMKAMYATGVMRGSLEGESLYAHAERGITRSEAMTILGRLLPKGYPLPELTFTDSEQVPQWAAEHVRLLVGLGVVGGYDGRVNPGDAVKRSEVAKMLVTLM